MAGSYSYIFRKVAYEKAARHLRRLEDLRDRAVAEGQGPALAHYAATFPLPEQEDPMELFTPADINKMWGITATTEEEQEEEDEEGSSSLDYLAITRPFPYWESGSESEGEGEGEGDGDDGDYEHERDSAEEDMALLETTTLFDGMTLLEDETLLDTTTPIDATLIDATLIDATTLDATAPPDDSTTFKDWDNDDAWNNQASQTPQFTTSTWEPVDPSDDESYISETSWSISSSDDTTDSGSTTTTTTTTTTIPPRDPLIDPSSICPSPDAITGAQMSLLLAQIDKARLIKSVIDSSVWELRNMDNKREDRRHRRAAMEGRDGDDDDGGTRRRSKLRKVMTAQDLDKPRRNKDKSWYDTKW